MPTQIAFDAIKEALTRRGFPIIPEAAATPGTDLLRGQNVPEATVPETQVQSLNQVGTSKSEAQTIVEALAARLKKIQ